jgi:FkbM family methyltransferase
VKSGPSACLQNVRQNLNNMKAKFYSLVISLWTYFPLKKQLIFLLKSVNIDFDKYIRDLWFVGKFKVFIGKLSFYLFAEKSDKGMLEIYYKGIAKCWDSKSILIWKQLASRSETIFDIGANFGLYSLVAKMTNSKSKVYAFEPSLHALKMLRKNIAINNYEIEVYDIALSNVNGTANFNDLEKSSAASSLVIDTAEINKENLSLRQVKTITLNDFIKQKQISKIDLVSLDVELFETEVLEGMGDLISTHLPDFLMEVINNEIGEKIECFFHDKGYLFYEINERDMTITHRKHLKRDDNRNHSFNFLICSKEIAENLKL